MTEAERRDSAVTKYYSEIFGSAAWLLAHATDFRGLPLAALDALITVPYRLGQLRLYRRQGKPVAVAAWAFVTPAVEERVLSGGEGLRPEEWQSGDRLWLVYMAAPFGEQQVVLDDLRSTLFGDRAIRPLAAECAMDRKPRARFAAPYPQIVYSTFNPNFVYRKATREDVADLAPRLRQADVEEILAATGLAAEQGLAASFDNSPHCFSAFSDGRLVAMFGVGRTSEDGVGLLWMLSSNISRHARTLLNDSPWWLDLLGRDYRVLTNRVSLRNRPMVAWLNRIGVTFGQQIAMGANAVPFVEFTWNPSQEKRAGG